MIIFNAIHLGLIPITGSENLPLVRMPGKKISFGIETPLIPPR
jgi:hypothetical protein